MYCARLIQGKSDNFEIILEKVLLWIRAQHTMQDAVWIFFWNPIYAIGKFNAMCFILFSSCGAPTSGIFVQDSALWYLQPPVK